LWRKNASCRGEAARAAEPATRPGGEKQENRRNDRQLDQNHQCRRGVATTWEATKYLRRAEKACRRYIPCSLPLRFNALISSSLRLILPDRVISSTRLERKSLKRSSCLPSRS